MIQDHKLLENFHALSPDKQAEVIDFIEFLQSKQKVQNPEKRPWKDIAGIAPEMVLGDAQEWVNQHRKDSDKHRSNR